MSTPAASARQWNWFRTVQLDSLNTTRGIGGALRATHRLVAMPSIEGGCCSTPASVPDDLPSRRPRKAREVFGVDLTTAIDAAYRNIGKRDNVHLDPGRHFCAAVSRAHLRSGLFDRRPPSHARSAGRRSRASPRRSSHADGWRSICTRDMASSHRRSDADSRSSPHGCRSA